MKKSDHIEKMLDDALSSADGAGRAPAKPFLFTRIRARMERNDGTAWETAVKFITRPAVAFAGLCLVIGINVGVIIYNQPAAPFSASKQIENADEFSTSVATLDYTDNIEP